MRKAIIKTVSLITFFTMSLGLLGCNKAIIPEKAVDKEASRVGIDSIEFISATGDKSNPNYAKFRNHWDSEYGDRTFDESLLSSDKAMELIDEIVALPDMYGDMEEEYAYCIVLDYYDENNDEKRIYKHGYGEYPDNWSKIVADINEVTENTGNLSDSTDLVTIDADYLRANSKFDLHEDTYPDGVTLEDVIAQYPLTYYDVYGYGYSVVDVKLKLYLYDYYDLASHRITDETTAKASNFDELLDYANKNLDTVDEERTVSVVGTYKDYEFEIVKFDSLDEWKSKSSVVETVCSNDGTYDVIREFNAGCEGMTNREDWSMYLDPSNRFVIVTQCRDYTLVYDFLTQNE